MFVGNVNTNMIKSWSRC